MFVIFFFPFNQAGLFKTMQCKQELADVSEWALGFSRELKQKLAIY